MTSIGEVLHRHGSIGSLDPALFTIQTAKRLFRG